MIFHPENIAKLSGAFYFSGNVSGVSLQLDNMLDNSFLVTVADESNIQKVELNGVYDGRPGYARGDIKTDTFSPKNQYVRNFEYEFENTSQDPAVLRAYVGVAVSEMLILCGELVNQSDTGVTMAMLGFPNY